MLLSCTEVGKELNMGKSEVWDLVASNVLSNYGNSHRPMVHKDDLKEYVKLLNGEITSEKFNELKTQTRQFYDASFTNHLEHMGNSNNITSRSLESIENKVISNRLEQLAEILETGRLPIETVISELRHISNEFKELSEFNYMKTISQLFKHEETNTTQQYIEGKESVVNEEFKKKANTLFELYCADVISEEKFKSEIKLLKDGQ